MTDRAVQRRVAGVGSRRQVPLLPERPRVRAAALDRSSGTSRPTARPASSRWRCARTSTHPFPPESDEVKIADEKKDEPKADDEADEKKAEATPRRRRTPRRRTRRTTKPAPSRQRAGPIDFDGLAAARDARAASTADNYGGLSATKGQPALRRRRRRLLRPRRATRSRRCAIFSFEGPQGDARSPRTSAATRSRPTARRCWSRTGDGVTRSTTPTPAGARIEEDGLDRRA